MNTHRHVHKNKTKVNHLLFIENENGQRLLEIRFQGPRNEHGGDQVPPDAVHSQSHWYPETERILREWSS